MKNLYVDPFRKKDPLSKYKKDMWKPEYAHLSLEELDALAANRAVESTKVKGITQGLKTIDAQRQIATRQPPPLSISIATTGADIARYNDTIAKYNAARELTSNPYKQLQLLQSGATEVGTGSPWDAKYATELYQKLNAARQGKRAEMDEERQVIEAIKAAKQRRLGSNNVMR